MLKFILYHNKLAGIFVPIVSFLALLWSWNKWQRARTTRIRIKIGRTIAMASSAQGDIGNDLGKGYAQSF
uniref:Uncharacterized protein n=1 Tax=Trichuris muris TaxID=70415 RepID=A0A5S6QVR4_TRIMR